MLGGKWRRVAEPSLKLKRNYSYQVKKMKKFSKLNFPHPILMIFLEVEGLMKGSYELKL